MIIDLTKDECEKILASLNYAHLGCCDGDEPCVVPVTYVYHGGFFYDFTHEGKKIDILRKNGNMCMQVERVKSEFEWESVMCWGKFEEVKEEAAIQEIKLLLAEQHGKALLSNQEAPFSPMLLPDPDDKAVVIYRMQPYRITGRAERK